MMASAVHPNTTTATAPAAATTNTTNSTAASTTATSRYVPIRPAFRPLLPKPSAKVSVNTTVAPPSSTSSSCSNSGSFSSHPISRPRIETCSITKKRKERRSLKNGPSTTSLSSSLSNALSSSVAGGAANSSGSVPLARSGSESIKSQINVRRSASMNSGSSLATLPATIAPASLTKRHSSIPPEHHANSSIRNPTAAAAGIRSSSSSPSSLSSGSTAVSARSNKSSNLSSASPSLSSSLSSSPILSPTEDPTLINSTKKHSIAVSPSDLWSWENSCSEMSSQLDLDHKLNYSDISSDEGSPIMSNELMANFELEAFSDELVGSLESYLTPEPEDEVVYDPLEFFGPTLA